MREAAVVKDGSIVNTIVIPDGPEGDAFLSETCLEITTINPKPGIGWAYNKNGFVAPEAELFTIEDVRAQRAARYAAETDPMYWKVMRAEDGLSLQDWVDAVEQIRVDLPYPDVP